MKNDKGLTKVNYISADKLSAINSFGDEYNIGDKVLNEAADYDEAEVTGFEVTERLSEVNVMTTKGSVHIDYLRKKQ